MVDFQPKDAVAIVALLGIFALKYFGHNGGLDTAGALILGYYFAHRRDGIDKGV